MKIVLNAVSAKMGGAVTYLANLLRWLPPPESGMEFRIYLPPETAAKLEDLAPNIHLETTEIGRASMMKRLWWEQVTLRRALREWHADALFSTANFGMFCCPVRQILLVRNTLYFSKIYRQMFLPKHSLRYRMEFELRRRLIGWSARSADVVMTPTRATLDELREWVRLKGRETLVNPYGVPLPELRAGWKEGTRSFDSARDNEIRLLFVSYYCEHKNLRTLLKAMPVLNQQGGRKYVLKTTADPAWQGADWTLTHASDSALAEKPEVARWVEIVGLQDRERTARLYGEADIFVFPALTESFGFPMAEAMAFGIPIVAADTPVNREMCDGAAIYFDHLDAQDLAEKVRELADDLTRRRVMSMNGRRQAHLRFNWIEHARRLIEATGTSLSKGRPLNENGSSSREDTAVMTR